MITEAASFRGTSCLFPAKSPIERSKCNYNYILAPAILTPLGMENGKITDSQIKTSHFYWLSTGARTHHSGLSSRLNLRESGFLGAGWRPLTSPTYNQQWLEVNTFAIKGPC